MARGIEGRTPFLHGGLPAHADGLDWSELVGDGQTKRALRAAWADRVPRAEERKRAFRAPLDDWFTGPVAARVVDRLARYRDRFAALGVAPDGVDGVADGLRAGRPGSAGTAFALLTLGAWAAWLDAGGYRCATGQTGAS